MFLSAPSSSSTVHVSTTNTNAGPTTFLKESKPNSDEVDENDDAMDMDVNDMDEDGDDMPFSLGLKKEYSMVL